MATSAISAGTFDSYSGTTNTSTTKTTLGKDDFLQLMITELKYQNPLEPMEDKDFIGQMANFSSLEQMQNLNKSFESLATSNQDQIDTLSSILATLINGNQLQQAATFIGKEIEYAVTDSTGKVTTATGKVDSITRGTSGVYLNVGSNKVSFDQITVIK